MIDGTITRKTNTADKFGARLDSVADFIFVVISLAKLLPVLTVPIWLWVWISAIAVIKAANIISTLIITKNFLAEHTVMNKLTGFLLFILPLTLSIIELKYSAATACVVATIAAIQETYYIKKRF